jgi:hypothetical protein
MFSPRRRLVLAAALFLGWIGWLGYLAATTTHPEVLSRPQFLVSNLYAVADLTGPAERPDATVTLREVGGPARDLAGLHPGDSLLVGNLPKVNRGWSGPGRYILPLTRRRDGTCLLTRTPPSPGYPVETGSEPADRFRIYHADERTLEQLRQMGL